MSSNARKLVVLAVLGVALLMLTGLGVRLQEDHHLSWFLVTVLAQGVIYLAGVFLILSTKKLPGALAAILIVAALLRINVLFAPPQLSDDIYRYIWDGRVQAAGINPYRYVPDSPRLDDLQDDRIFPHINRSDYARTIYPPVAQFIFLAATRVSESVTWMKMVMVGFEGLAVWILIRLLGSFGLPAERVLIYAWNPVTVWEFSGSGHVDAAAIAFLVLALWMRRRNAPALAGVSLGCATLIKFYPALLFPALYRRWDWKMPAAFVGTGILAYLPYAKVGWGALGFLPGYVEEEGLKSGERFYLWTLLQRVRPVSWFDGEWYLALLVLLLAVVAGWFLLRRSQADTDFLVAAAVLASLCTALFSPHYPWYFAWVVALMVLVPYAPMIYLSAVVLLLYGTNLPGRSEFLFQINTFLYATLVLLMAGHWLWRRRQSPTVRAVAMSRHAERPNAT